MWYYPLNVHQSPVEERVGRSVEDMRKKVEAAPSSSLI